MRDWTAVLKGDIYCAPACGANCTKKQYDTAVKKANLLKEKCEKEIGDVWKIRVHENLGWHYSVFLEGGNISISEYEEPKRYHISFRGGTPSHLYVHDTSTNLKELYDMQMKQIQEELERLQKIFNNNQIESC